MAARRRLLLAAGATSLAGLAAASGGWWPATAGATASETGSGPLAVETTSLSYTETGATYYDQLYATGGEGSDRWSSVGPMPRGLHLSRNGLIAGYPSTPGSFPIEVSVTDGQGAEVEGSLTLVIGAGPTIETESLPEGRVGARYATRLVATGGKGPYRWSVATAKSPLPGGLLLSSRGVLSGLPGTEGTTSTTLKVVDSAGGTATVPLSVTVLPPPPPPEAYVVAGATGAVTSYGTPALPSRTGRVKGKVVGVATPPNGGGYWLLTSTGAVLGEGSAHTLGSVGRNYLKGRLIGIAPSSEGTGYWVASSTGLVYGFGSAKALGTSRERRAAARRLGQVVGIAASPTGTGYWLVGSTGQVASFGTAAAYGSIPSKLRIHAVGIAADSSGTGYFVASSAGRVFAFGSGAALGATTGPRAGVFVSIASPASGLGYWLVTDTGLVDQVGSARGLEPIPEHPRPAGAVSIASAP